MTESLLLLLAVAAIAAAAWFAYRSASVDPIRAERDRLRAELEGVRRQNLELATELAGARAQKSERSESEEVRFLALAAKALDASQQTFMNMAKETFEKHQQAAAGGVKEVLTPAQEALTKLAGSVDALEKARLQDKSALGEQMRAIGETLAKTQTETGRLVNALRAAPKTRGRWGEETLRNVLELSGLSEHADFTEQTTTLDGSGKMLRPDVIIRLPGGRSIIVDAKVALSGYLDAMDATDEAERERCLNKHAAELRAHVKSLSLKDYSKHIAESADFVALFIPGENFFAAAVERDGTLFEDAMKARVIIVTPVTLMALARSISYGWRQEQSAKNAQEIAELGRDLFRRMAVMVDHMGKVGDSIGKSVKTYNEMIGSVESRVLPQARKFKELGAGDAGIDIASPPQIETAPRLPPPPEQLELMPPQAAKRGR
ncbi:MAG: DNA recombination protein RmuC [Phycisphaerales bacterium]|nr:DNA recombination protein RmuC [Hyphomonadaceae bacterium]